MKIETHYSEETVETLGIDKSQAFGFSKDAEEMIFTMFTKNIYSNPIGSVVREITSNCFDSHREANVHEAVVIKLTKENNSHYISFTDVGMGMSRERMTKVYAQYFNSTKRDTNNQIGGFGIGGKTPLAYAESFFLITTYNGVRYTYNIRKGKTSPVLDLMDVTKVKEHNGTTIKIPVKQNDISTFEREIVRQLYYFENVIFEGFSTNIKNDYQIFEGDSFFYRGSDYSNYVHLCLGRVAYPIDFNVFEDIDTSEWNVPVAIKLDIGEINVTVSREAIDYTAATKKLIIKKLNQIKKEMVDMLDKQHEKINSLEDFYRLEENGSMLALNANVSINIHPFTTYTKATFKRLNELKIPSRAEIISYFYSISTFGKKTKNTRQWDRSLRSVGDDKVYLVTGDGEMTRKKNAFMKHTYKLFNTIKRKDFEITEVKELVKTLTPEKSTADLKVIFKQFRELQKEAYDIVERKVKKYSQINVPDGFTVALSKYDPNQELPVAIKSKYSYNRMRVKMSDLAKSKATIYYTDRDSSYELEWLARHYTELFGKVKEDNKFSLGYGDYEFKPVKFIVVAKGNFQHLAELKNVKPLSEFKKLLMRKRNLVMKIVEAKHFQKRYYEQNNLFLNQALFNVIDKPYAKILKAIDTLKNEFAGLKSLSIDVSETSDLLKRMDIDYSSIKFRGDDLFDLVKEKTDKNSMLKYVKISDQFDPNDSRYTKEEINDILQLLSFAYVK